MVESVNQGCEVLQVDLGERSYPIYVGADLLNRCGSVVAGSVKTRTVALVSNDTVAELYYDRVERSLLEAGFVVNRIIVPDGEVYKSPETLAKVYDAAFAAGLDRGSIFVALGGGVVGDLTGYAAATFMRGVPFVQIPTTLLAQVDSSVGGKTGINHPRGKNLIGAFHQPVAVIADVRTLQTLPEREYASGLAEVIKYGMSLDAELFCYIEENVPLIQARDPKVLGHLVATSCRLKASIVEMDEREGGVRAVLNYGHTFGHAVETLTSFSQFTHGEAVAIGMVQASRIAVLRGLASEGDSLRLRGLLLCFGLPVDLPAFSVAEYEQAMRLDKKVRSGDLTFVLNKGIGGYTFSKEQDIARLVEELQNSTLNV